MNPSGERAFIPWSWTITASPMCDKAQCEVESAEKIRTRSCAVALAEYSATHNYRGLTWIPAIRFTHKNHAQTGPILANPQGYLPCRSGFYLKLRAQLIVLAVATILIAPWLSAATFCSQQENSSRENCPADCPMDCPEQAPSAPAKVLCCQVAPAENAIPLSVPRLQASSLTMDLDAAEVAPGLQNPVADVPFAALGEIRGHTSPSFQALLCTFLI